MKKKSTKLKRTYWSLIVIFVLINLMAFSHAYKLTHFTDENVQKTRTTAKYSTFQKIKIALLGVNNPRPKNTSFPTQKYETIKLQSNKEIECWYIQTENAKGTVILFHGYGGQKSSLIDKSDEFLKLGYNTLLVDFMGCGGSEGDETTIGYKEAENVKTAFDYITKNGEKNVYLFGVSLGAVAILKCIRDYQISPKGIIIECPFGSMYQTTCARFKVMKFPAFPMAGLIDFWGGAQNGFWAFGHNPIEYAKSVKCPVLLLYGEKDRNVSRWEIDEIYKNLKGKKVLKTYPLAGHENYLIQYKEEWIKDIHNFM